VNARRSSREEDAFDTPHTYIPLLIESAKGCERYIQRSSGRKWREIGQDRCRGRLDQRRSADKGEEMVNEGSRGSPRSEVKTSRKSTGGFAAAGSLGTEDVLKKLRDSTDTLKGSTQRRLFIGTVVPLL
jgi:hypothetical protein